jgi:hypothetical protein
VLEDGGGITGLRAAAAATGSLAAVPGTGRFTESSTAAP